MLTIKINAEKLREAAFKWNQKELRNINKQQEQIIDKYLSGFFLFKKPTRHEAMAKLSFAEGFKYKLLSAKAEDVFEQYKMIRTACNLAEDGIVQINAETAYRIFGDTQ